VLKKGQDDSTGGGPSLERIRTDCRWLGGKNKGFLKGFVGRFPLPCVYFCVTCSQSVVTVSRSYIRRA
jgi:hypothetical protein